MKKGKTAFRQSEKKEKRNKSQGEGEEKLKKVEKLLGPKELERLRGFKVLVPLLSKREAHPIFIEAVASKAREIILLLVIDTNAMTGQFGFATNEIAAGNHLMQQVKEFLGKKRKTCNDVIEWGDTATKIEHMAELHQVDKVYVVKQENHFFKKLLRDLQEKLKGIEIEAVSLP